MKPLIFKLINTYHEWKKSMRFIHTNQPFNPDKNKWRKKTKRYKVNNMKIKN